MKRFTLLLAALMLVSSTVGCGCVRRLRDRLCRGSYCGPAAAVAPAAIASPGMYAAPAQTPYQQPVQQPVMAPAPMMMMAPQPMMTNCVPCDPCCIPCDPCGGGYYGAGYPMNGMYDSGWSGSCGCSGGSDYDSSSAPVPAGGGFNDPAPVGSGDRGA
ncbi:hypothetical protein Pla123a_12770 [Posidoniimonas polymericola]|uniref:Uncharacterized protein n=1 Tax=Posidoniimonas polymericola TaxID=2528002 RepID=A0A5C5YU23_9BACT|nr:hypothetical protein [Posidoniimonas polymericola]TWT78485.1 hypothetical protein Pla123a_12770 [Posidoniimonas polymericola]